MLLSQLRKAFSNFVQCITSHNIVLPQSITLYDESPIIARKSGGPLVISYLGFTSGDISVGELELCQSPRLLLIIPGKDLRDGINPSLSPAIHNSQGQRL